MAARATGARVHSGASHDRGSCVEKVGLVHELVLSGANFQGEVIVSLV